MPTLNTEQRNKLERTVIAARRIAEVGARAALEAFAVGHHEPYGHMSVEQRKQRTHMRARARQLGDQQDKNGRLELTHIAHECAYEHWHRMLFARFLAENGLLIEPDSGVAISLEECKELAKDAGTDLWTLAGRYAQGMLPQIFRPDDPLLQSTLAKEHQLDLERKLDSLSAEVFTASDSLGWCYQFWQSAEKERVNKSGQKIGADELPAVTQLFTEDYMVDFLLDNTLGAWWWGRRLSVVGDRLSEAKREEDCRRLIALPECPWKYLRFVKDVKVGWRPAAGTFDGWPQTAKELKCLDPCMGSGHFVVAMFERLVAMRMAEEGLSEKDAVVVVIRDNLFGLEIDPRCTQIAAFNVALAAWRRVGYCTLPEMGIACSGLAPNSTIVEWLKLAGNNDKLQRGMEQLYHLFGAAPILGSLINPRSGEGDLLVAAYHELQPLLEKALAQEARDEAAHEMAVTAKGMGKAAQILTDHFDLVATNVPYLGMPKQREDLRDFCLADHSEAKGDLSTCFQERALSFCRPGGTTALVSLQNWLYLVTYKRLRASILSQCTLNLLAGLGPRGFRTPMYDFNVMLGILTKSRPPDLSDFSGIDISSAGSPEEKAAGLKTFEPASLRQSAQLDNPDKRISLQSITGSVLLSSFAASHLGICTGDYPRFGRGFWELKDLRKDWAPQQSTVATTCLFGGMSNVLLWEGGRGSFHDFLCERLGEDGISSWLRGGDAWGKTGVIVTAMGELPASLYYGSLFDNNVTVIIPNHIEHLPAIWSSCKSPDFRKAVRKINQSLKITDQSMVAIPFDLAHWQGVAKKQYPAGLPSPHTSDPTQWLFDGHPRNSDVPLHVAVARLLDYRWPRQTGSSFPDCPALAPDGLEALADEDGVVCIPSVRGEEPAAERLRRLLTKAYGKAWTATKERELIAATGSTATDLDEWLHNDFFQQHCDLFHQRPFVWHIWDGRKRDGFHVLVNYHKLADGTNGRKLLEKLTHAYLNDWIARQRDGVKYGEGGAEERLAAAEELKARMEAIIEGEPPFDIFVRWKPLHQQPIGWDPDINDGVRLNIRPFLAQDLPRGRAGAGILRWKPSIKWDKDRGKEPERPKSDYPWFWKWDETSQDFMGGREFDGNRWNDCHYTNAVRHKARKET